MSETPTALFAPDDLVELLRESVTDLVAVIGERRQRVWFNDAYCLTLGFTRADLDSGDSTLIVHPDDREKVRRVFEESMATGRGRALEYRLQHRDGSWVWLESRGRVVRGVPGIGQCLVIVARDVTKRKEREMHKLATERRLLGQRRMLACLMRADEFRLGQWDGLMRQVTAAARTALECPRMSLWWLHGDVLHGAGQGEQGEWTNGSRLTVRLSPDYVLALASAPVVPFSVDDPVTACWVRAGVTLAAGLHVPLTRSALLAGVLVFEAAASRFAWMPDEIGFAGSLGALLLQAVEVRERQEAYAALERSQRQLAAELAEAASYVRALLPPDRAAGPRIEAVFQPSTTLGGDAYGWHDLDDCHVAFYLLDVSGHGVGSALLSVSALNVIRTATLPGVDFQDPAAVLDGLNRTFEMERHNQLYFTLWYGVWNRETGHLRYATAGHPPAVLLRPGGEVERLGHPGLMIGALAEVTYTARAATVAPGDRLYIFSDGAYEIVRPDGRLWTEGEFLVALREFDAGRAPLPEFLQRLALERATPGFEDDVSLVRVWF